MADTQVREQCSVQSCAGNAEHTWSTGETHAEEATWPLCLPHYRRMRRGEQWATHTDLPTSTEQRILIGPDLAVRTRETLHGWHLSVEFAGDGRNIRLALRTHDNSFGVLLDGQQATQLSEALSELGDGRPERNWNY